ncbi:MAG: LysR family transcriptional regulator [Pseudolabrys sp.]|nr:LysR family transcriptional regulator [Pseudolabrys sp.]
MDLLSLRYFNEVVRQRSISKAASTLSVVQPALTRRVQLLEESLGAQLLMRHRRGVEPTEQGSLVFERAEVLLRMAGEIESEVQSQINEPTGQIRFGFPPSVGLLFIGRLLSDFVPRHPRVTFYLQEGFSRSIRDSLLAGRIDVAIMSPEADHPDLDAQFLFEEDLWLITRASDWTFGNSKSLSPDVLRDRELLLSSYLKLALDRVSIERRLPFRIVVEADSLSALREATRAGAGFFVTPHISVERELESGEFRGAPVKGLTVSRALFQRRDRPPTRALQAFIAMIAVGTQELCARHPKRFRAVAS